MDKDTLSNHINSVIGNYGKMYTIDGDVLDVVGVADVWITLQNRSMWTLQLVKHIPKLKKDLIFVGQIGNNGHIVVAFYGEYGRSQRVLV